MHLHPDTSRFEKSKDPAGRGLTLEQKVPLVLTGLLVFLLAVAVAVAYREVEASARVASDERLERVALQVSEIVQGAVAERMELLNAAASNDHVRNVAVGGVQPDSLAMGAALADLALPTDPLERVLILDRSGAPVYVWGGSEDVYARVARGSVEFQNEGGYGRWLDADSMLLTQAATHVRQGEQTIGYLLHMRPFGSNALASQAEELLGPEAIVSFVEDTGRWVSVQGVPVEGPRRALTAGPLQIRRGAERYLAHVVDIPATPWVLVAELPISVVLQRPREFLGRMAALLLVISLAGAIGAWVLSRRFTNPLKVLGAAAGKIASGDYSHRVDLRRTDELGTLAGAFNSMAGRVQESDAELKRQVDQARELATELERANRQLRELMDEAEVARWAAESANRAKSDFLATVTHEIRTPINAIVGYADLLLLGIPCEPAPEQVEQLERVRESGNRLTRLVDDVLDLAKIEAGYLEIDSSVGLVEEAIHGALRMTEPAAAAKGVAVSTNVEPFGRTPYAGDPGRVEQIVMNLLGNAIKFTPAGGSVTVTCKAPAPDDSGQDHPDFVQITVMDTGPGIPAEKQEVVFDRFVQGDTGYRRSHEGAGLGLSISRELARLMGGDITLESREGAGAAFTLRLKSANSAH